MNRRSRHILIVAIAVGTATLASLGIYRAISRIPVREVEVAKTFVVVAARSLPPGVRLTASDIRVAAWPSSSPVAGSYATADAVIDRALLASVVENEPLLESKVAPLAAGAGLSPAIPAGMRAMAVKVDEVIGVAGYLDSGTRVDLVVTIRNREESTSRTVVSNVQVLSAGTRYEQERVRDGKENPSTTAVVTLLVSPQDAERIALAQAEGQIMLVLRNPLDTDPTTTGGVRTAGLFGEPEPPPAPVPAVRRVIQPKAQPVVTPPPAPAPPPPYVVEAIRAAKRTEEEVER